MIIGKGRNMIKITKNEKDFLVSKGMKFGDMLHRTYSGHTTYYATEDPRVLKLLNNYNDSIRHKQ